MAREDWRRPDTFSAQPGRRRVAMEIAYDGRAYVGWQIQDSGLAVQQVVLDAVKQLTGQKILKYAVVDAQTAVCTLSDKLPMQRWMIVQFRQRLFAVV